jgi:hypothetical protein
MKRFADWVVDTRVGALVVANTALVLGLISLIIGGTLR